MKVLMLSLDRSVLVPDSQTARRMIAFGTYMDALHIVVHAPRHPSGAPVHLSDSVTVYPTATRTAVGYFIRAYMLGSRVIRVNGFSSTYDRITTQDAFPTGFVGFLLRVWYRIPIQIQVHTEFFNPIFFRESFFQLAQYFANCILLPRADGVRVVSQAIGRYCRRELNISLERISVVSVFYDHFLISAPSHVNSLRARYRKFRKIALFSGRLISSKGVVVAIRAMARIAPIDAGIGFIILGSGPHEGVLRVAVGNASNIAFEPWTEDVASYYRIADFFIFPSLYEGLPRAVLEAMIAGLPVVMADIGCAPELVCDGESGVIVPQNDDSALADAILRLARDEALCARMGNAARAAAYQVGPSTLQEYSKIVVRGIESSFFNV